MARITIEGYDQVMADINRRGSALRPIIEEALMSGAQIIKGKMLEEEKSSFVAPSGELGTTIEPNGPWHHGDASGIYVGFAGDYKGRRGSPRRAGLVAAMVEYKHKNPWVKRSMTKSKRRVNSIVAQMLGGRGSVSSEWGGL